MVCSFGGSSAGGPVSATAGLWGVILSIVICFCSAISMEFDLSYDGRKEMIDGLYICSVRNCSLSQRLDQ